MGGIRLTFEKLATILTQIKACLNLRPLTAIPDSDEGVKALMPGHFLVGGPPEALLDFLLPDSSAMTLASVPGFGTLSIEVLASGVPRPAAKPY